MGELAMKDTEARKRLASLFDDGILQKLTLLPNLQILMLR